MPVCNSPRQDQCLQRAVDILECGIPAMHAGGATDPAGRRPPDAIQAGRYRVPSSRKA